MKVYTVTAHTWNQPQGQVDIEVILVASSVESAKELAQARARSMGLNIYRWDDLGGLTAITRYVIKEYEVDEVNLK